MFLGAVVVAGILSGWAAILYAQLRHAGLVALALAAPLPVLVLGQAIVSLPGVPAIADAPFLSLLAYVFAVVALQGAMARAARGICEGATPREAVGSALVETAVQTGGVLIALVIVLLALGLLSEQVMDCLAGIALAAAAFVLVLGGGWVARWFSYSEGFIARANAARERRERLTESLSFLAQARWALSVSASAVVLMTVAAFGSAALVVEAAPALMGVRLGMAVLAAFAVFAIALRNWRLGVALILTLCVVLPFGLWPIARTAMPVRAEDVVVFAMTLAVFAQPAMALGRRLAQALGEGDAPDVAVAYALSTGGADAVPAAGLALLPWLVITLAGGLTRFELGAGLAAPGATILAFPAFAAALLLLFPRYRSVEEVFGRR